MSDFYRKKSGAFFSFLRRRGIYIAVVVLLRVLSALHISNFAAEKLRTI